MGTDMSMVTMAMTPMGTPTMGMDTRTDAALLRLIWLASPALPVGGFSYSEGLEAAVEAALVHDEASAGNWLVDQFALVLARADLAVVARGVAAFRARDALAVDALDQWMRRTRETREMRLQSDQMGRSLGDWAVSLGHACERSAHTYPVAFARVAATVDASVQDIVLAFGFGWAENMAQAAVKAVPLGQSAGQRIVQRLANALPQAAQMAVALPDDDRQAFAPMLAILSSRHETQYSRLFRS
ncbi:MAG: urease accessory protein UreF [Ramlibacter sp.]